MGEKEKVMGSCHEPGSFFGDYEYPKEWTKKEYKVKPSNVVGLDKKTIREIRNPLWFRLYKKIIIFLNGRETERGKNEQRRLLV